MQIEEINFSVSNLFSREAVKEIKNPDGTCNRYTETTGTLGYPVTQVESGVACSDTSGGGSSGGMTDGDSTSGGTTSGGSTGSLGGNGDGADDGFGSGSYGGGFTTPLAEKEDTDSMASELRIKFSLSGQAYLWLKNNAYTVLMIDEFLDDNQNSMQAENFAKQMLNQMINNPGLIFDVEASFKSPFNIDKSTITDATPEGKKFNTVYKSLTESPEFKRLFLDVFDGTQTRFNVKFVIGDITNGANGNTDTNLSNPTLNIITISPAFLDRSNKMEIGKTILHECIHAYLNAKMVDPTIGTSIPNLNNMEFCDVVNQKYSDFSPGQNQHNFIYNFMLPTMVRVLSEVKEKLVSAEDNTTMNALKMSIPIGSPLTSFDWGGFIHNLSLIGLQNCSFFQKEIGTFNSFGAPITIINQTLMDAYNQYNNFGHLYLHP